MPPKKSANQKEESIIIAVDIGRSCKKEDKPSEFFIQTKECLSLIIQRKILSKSPDRISLLLLGPDQSHGATVASGCKNVSCVFGLQSVTWDMLRFVTSEMSPTNNQSDWVTSFEIAIEMLRLADTPRKKIVLISQFAYPVSKKNLKCHLKSLKELEISVVIIGPDHFSDIIFERYGEPSAKKRKCEEEQTLDEQANERLIQEMWNELETSLQVCTFDLALRQLTITPVPPVGRSAWNAVLNIGDIEICISALVKIKINSAPPKNYKVLKNESKERVSTAVAEASQAPGNKTDVLEGITSGKESRYTTKDSERGEVSAVPVTEEEVIKGHKYGSTIVPIGEADEEAFKFKPGEKSLSVLGFTKMKNLNLGLILGDGCRVIVPRQNDTNSEVALSALVQAMHETGTCAVARKVYAQDKGHAVVLLSPLLEEIEDDSGATVVKECLIMNELPYKEGVKYVEFPSLPADITDEQKSAIDDLIDGMNLMTADVGPDGLKAEAFEVSTLREFKSQLYQYFVVQRALYPNKPLPKTVPSRLNDSYTLPHSLREKNALCSQKIKTLFPITFVQQKSKFRKRQEENYEEAEPMVVEEDKRMKIPEDFPKPEILEKEDSSIQNIKILFQEYCCPPSKALIWEITSGNTVSGEASKEAIFEALKNCIAQRRKFMVKANPIAYNEWIKELKENSLDYKEFWQRLKMIAANCGLITNAENVASDVTMEDATNFVYQDDAPIVLTSQDFTLFGGSTDTGRRERDELLDDLDLF